MVFLDPAAFEPNVYQDLSGLNQISGGPILRSSEPKTLKFAPNTLVQRLAAVRPLYRAQICTGFRQVGPETIFESGPLRNLRDSAAKEITLID